MQKSTVLANGFVAAPPRRRRMCRSALFSRIAMISGVPGAKNISRPPVGGLRQHGFSLDCEMFGSSARALERLGKPEAPTTARYGGIQQPAPARIRRNGQGWAKQLNVAAAKEIYRGKSPRRWIP